MKLKLTDNQIMLAVGVATLPAYFMINKFYKLQLVYGEAHLSKATLSWLILLLSWGMVSDRVASRLGGNVKRNGWLIYAAGTSILVGYVLV